MNLDRIAIEVESRLAAAAIIGSALVTQSDRSLEVTVVFDRTDGVSQGVWFGGDMCKRRSAEYLAEVAAQRLIEWFSEYDNPSAVNAPEAPRP